MHVAKIITTSVTGIALAFSMLASTLPANAATPGFHAAYFSESDFLARSPGQTGQFAVGYTNTGDQAWVSGAANQQANLATAAPLNNTTDFTAGWANGWLSANRYTAQNAALVAPGQIGFFIYNFTVPTNAAAGEHRFYGRPVIDGVTFMEDYGYYQSVVVQAGSVLINSTTPASPSTVSQPVVNGTGATPASTVTIYDGTTAVGTGTADSAGAFQIPTSVLAQGCHTLSASSTGPVSGQTAASGNTKSYCVDTTGPTVTSATAPNAGTVIATFSEAVDPTTAQTSTNYTIDGGVTVTSATLGADGQTVTLVVTGMTSPSGHTLTVQLVQDLAGNVMTTQAVPFTVNDTTPPTLSSASSTAPAGGGNATQVKATWSEPVVCNNVSTTYSVDGVTATYASGTGTTKCVLNLGATLAPGTTHVLTATNERDTAGNTQSPNPASATFTVATSTTTNLVLSSASNPSGETAQAVFNIPVSCPTCTGVGPTGTYTIQTSGGTVLAHGAVTNDATNLNANDMTITTSPFAADASCAATATTCVLQMTVTGETGANGETMLPSTQATTFTFTKDTTGPTLASAVQTGTTQDTFTVTWSEAVNAPNACVTTTCPFRILSGSTIVASTIPAETASSITLAATDGTAGDKKTTLTAATPIAGGSYQLTVVAGAVNDFAFTPNASAAGSTPLAVLDTSRPTLLSGVPAAGQCGAGQPCKVFTLTYSEKMATGGAGNILDLTHYTLNGAAIAGTASVDSTGTIETLNLTSSAPCTAGTSPCSESFSISGVTDVAGNVINPNPTINNFVRTF